MKYHVMGNQTITPESHKDLADLLTRTVDWVDKKLADGTLDCAYSFPAGGGFLIFNADSHEDFIKLLNDFPLKPLGEFEIHAAVDFSTATNIVINSIKNLD